MADEIIIETVSAEVIEVGVPGPQGPAGAAGTGLETLTTKGDTLYRGTSTGERLPIGTTGQILRVSASGIPEWGAAPASGVSSVNGETGAVTLDATDVGAAATNHSHQPSAIYCDAVDVADTTLSGGEPNGIYFRDGSDNGKAVYKSAQGYSLFWDEGEEEWVLGNVPQTAKYYIGTGNTEYPWQATSWALGPQGSGDTPVVDQALLSNFQRNAAQDAVSTRTPKTGNASSAEVVLGSDTRLTNARTPTAHTHEIATLASTGAGLGDLPVAQGDGTVAWQNGSAWAADNLSPADIAAAASNHTHILATDIATALAEDPDLCRDSLNLGDMATEPSSNFSTVSHGHGNITNDGKLGTTAGLPVVTGTAGAVATLALGAAGTVLTVNSGANGVEFAAASGGGFGEVRFDTATVYTYTGQAAEGSSESSAVWFIRRSEFSSAGSYVSTTTANNVQWANRLTASYS